MGSLLLATAACGTASNASAASKVPTFHQKLVSQVQQYFVKAKTASLGTSYQVTTAELDQDLKSNPGKYFLMDVRLPTGPSKAPGYQQGHIPGAVNIPYFDVGKDLGQIPKNKIIVTICYTGQWANQTAAILRLLGYRAYALHLSMSDWNQHLDILPHRTQVPNYPLVTGTKPGTFPKTGS